MASTSNALRAQVITHPAAAVAPVKNIRWYGRYPKDVTSLRTFKMRREWAEQRAAREKAAAIKTPAQELHSAIIYLETCDYLRNDALGKLRVAQQRAGVTMPRGGDVVHLVRTTSAASNCGRG